ncbi:MAG TPA: hypothetical protein PKI14_05075 [Fervidobacterium sp.]|nr:hypothetical protein [Fervidobacterium sp.]
MFNFDDMEEDLQAQEQEAADSAEDSADEILDSLEQSDESDDEDIDATMSQAVKRIEEANLFKLLIKQPVFSEGSASPDILRSVNKKVREFAKKELEILLGLRPAKEEVKVIQQKVESPFSEQEVSALKILASKITKREPSVQQSEEKVPTMNAIQIQETAQPKMQQARPVQPAMQQPKTQQQSKPVQKQQSQTPAKQQAAQAKKQAVTAQKKNRNLPKPKAMPNAAQLGAMYQMNQSGVVMTTEGINQSTVKTSNQLLGNIINQMAGIHTDNASPADSLDE